MSMCNLKLYKILTVISFFVCALSCIPFKANSLKKSESLADIKKKLWQQTPRDQATNLKTVLNFNLKKHIPGARPASFLASNNNNIYINDNTNGKLFTVSPDFQSINELGTYQLAYPTRIRELNDNLFVYDNKGINLFDKDGQFIKTINPFLKIQDFALISEDVYIASLADLKLDVDPNLIAVLNSNGKRIDSVGKAHFFDYSKTENKTFLEIQGGKVYVFYIYHPLFEVYDLKDKRLLQSVNINASIFHGLMELRKDKDFTNPEPAILNISKLIAGVKIFQDKVYVLLHTPNPEIVEFTLDGKEVQRYLSRETQSLDYFGLDIRLNNDTKQFFVGIIDYSSEPSIMVYEE